MKQEKRAKEEGKMPRIDPNALYTADQAARFLMDVEPGMTFSQALREINEAIERGELKVAGYLAGEP